MDQVNENSTAYLTVAFADKTGAPAVPSAATYRIDDVTNNRAIRATTSLTPAASIEITLAPTDNAIVGTASETHRVTVTAQYGGAGDAVNSEYDYQVVNLRYI